MIGILAFGQMKKTCIIDHKSFEISDVSSKQVSLLKITERRNAYSTFICFSLNLVKWLCECLQAAGCWADGSVLTRIKDGRKGVLIVRGRRMKGGT